MAAARGREPQIIGTSTVGAGTLLGPDVILGHPGKATLIVDRRFDAGRGVRIGDDCILRSGTVVYEGAVLVHQIHTAHHVVIRECARIGDGCVLGNGAVVREQAVLGRNVRLMESVVIAEGAVVGNDVFVGPNVSLTAGRYMTGALEAAGRMSRDEATQQEGRYWEGPSVVVEDDVRIGANAVILAGVRLGRGCLVASGAVVSTDVPPGGTAMGNPARVVGVRRKEDPQ